MQLLDTWGSPITLFTVGSVHLMFLTTIPGEPARFRTLDFRGANIRLSDSACEKRAEGVTIEDQVRSVIRLAIDNTDTEGGEEQAFLSMMLEGAAETGKSIDGSATGDQRPGEGVQAPVMVQQTMPRYTREARAARVEGAVVLRCIIRKNGRVTDCETQKGLGYGLDSSAKQEVESNWRFHPGTRRGRPVDVTATFEIHFTLKMRN